MDIILLDDLPHVGKLGQEVRVKPGYARNYLIPQKKAVSATAENRAYFEQKRAKLIAARAEAKAVAEVRKQAIDALVGIELSARANRQDGKLFGSVTIRDIARQLSLELQQPIHHTQVHLSQAPIRQLGEYQATIQLDPEIQATCNVRIVQQDR